MYCSSAEPVSWGDDAQVPMTPAQERQGEARPHVGESVSSEFAFPCVQMRLGLGRWVVGADGEVAFRYKNIIVCLALRASRRVAIPSPKAPATIFAVRTSALKCRISRNGWPRGLLSPTNFRTSYNHPAHRVVTTDKLQPPPLYARRTSSRTCSGYCCLSSVFSPAYTQPVTTRKRLERDCFGLNIPPPPRARRFGHRRCL